MLEHVYMEMLFKRVWAKLCLGPFGQIAYRRVAVVFQAQVSKATMGRKKAAMGRKKPAMGGKKAAKP
jgi:hypothetical protein